MKYKWKHISANTRPCPDVGPTLGQRRRRWPSVGPTSGQRLVFAGMAQDFQQARDIAHPALSQHRVNIRVAGLDQLSAIDPTLSQHNAEKIAERWHNTCVTTNWTKASSRWKCALCQSMIHISKFAEVNFIDNINYLNFSDNNYCFNRGDLKCQNKKKLYMLRL